MGGNQEQITDLITNLRETIGVSGCTDTIRGYLGMYLDKNVIDLIPQPWRPR